MVATLTPIYRSEESPPSKEFTPGIAAALQELVGSRITEVLPNLQTIIVDVIRPWELFKDNIGQFIWRDGSPVTLSPFLSQAGTNKVT